MGSVSNMDEPPDRDLSEIARRFGLTSGEPVSRIVNPEPVAYAEGHSETFWVVDQVKRTAYTIQATLLLVSEHAYWYVDDSIDIAVDDLGKAAEVYESNIHPIVTGAFGDIWNPGVDNDPRLTILHTPLNGSTVGYFSPKDEYPRQIQPRSNQREMIYMDGSWQKPGSQAYLTVLAHELQHAIHWNVDTGEDSWVDEGMSEVAVELSGYRAFHVNSFLGKPDTQLTHRPDGIGNSPPYYGASTLFFAYLMQHYGGYENLKGLVQEPADGINGVEAYLSPFGKTFLDVFKDWVVANYLDADEGPFGYPDRSVRTRDVHLMIDYGEKESVLPQFGAAYIDLRLKKGDALVSFQGDSEVAQVNTECHSGQFCWWGNRGDSIDTTLTREFDLSGLTEATLEFWTWFQLEEHWDYAYVEISADGGDTWTLLEGTHTTSENPVGGNFGNGYTGSSGEWVRETIDLSPYAGSSILVRFEYITDGAVYTDGFVIDDIAVPELGFFDDAEQGGGWLAEGFLRTDNALPQEYAVQIIEETSDGEASVREVALDGERMGEILIKGFGTRIEHAVIVVSPVTRGTHQPARYALAVRPVDD